MNKFTTCYKDPLTKTSWRRIGDLVQLYWPKDDQDLQIRLNGDRYETRSMVRGGINEWMPWMEVETNEIELAGVRAHRALVTNVSTEPRTPKVPTVQVWTKLDDETMMNDTTPSVLVKKGGFGNLIKLSGMGSDRKWRKVRDDAAGRLVADAWAQTMSPPAEQSVSPFVASQWTDPNGTTWHRGPDQSIGELRIDKPRRVFAMAHDGTIDWRYPSAKRWLKVSDEWHARVQAALIAMYPLHAAIKICQSICATDGDEVDQALNEFRVRTTGALDHAQAFTVFEEGLRYVSGGQHAMPHSWIRSIVVDAMSIGKTTPPVGTAQPTMEAPEGFDDGSGQLWVTTDDPQVVLGLPSDRWYACELRSDLMFRLKEEGGDWESWTSSESDGWAKLVAARFWPVARRVASTSSLEAPQGQSTVAAPSETWTHPETRHVWSRGPKKGEVACESHLFRINDKGQPEGRHKSAISWGLSAPHWKAWIVEAVDRLWTGFEAPTNDEVETKVIESIGPEARTAASFLDAALGHMRDRATTYDRPQGERSMGNCVLAFNQLTGHTLTEEQGWLFMAVLKITRTQQGKFRPDNYEDLAAYAGLAGEAAAKIR